MFSAVTYGITRSPGLAAANFLTGVFLDADHLPEYFIKHGFKIHPVEMYNVEMHLTGRKSVLLLHSFDLLTLGFGLLYIAGAHAMAWAVYLGGVQHVMLDLTYNPTKSAWAYFLAYRIYRKFDTDALYHREKTKSFWEKKKKSLFTR
jgi:hypothetical protein